MTAAQIYRLLFEGGNYAKQWLIKLSHETAGDLYYVNNNENVTFDSQLYKAANFDYTPPNQETQKPSTESRCLSSAEHGNFRWKKMKRYSRTLMLSTAFLRSKPLFN